jgi:hypothetical protein
VRGSNFEPKKVRKAKRKMLLRGLAGNAVADVRTEFEDRAEFYRNLRMVKLKRRKLAKEMTFLAQGLQVLRIEVSRVENRYPDFSSRLIDDARDLTKSAYVSASVAADELAVFAMRRVYYVKEF